MKKKILSLLCILSTLLFIGCSFKETKENTKYGYILDENHEERKILVDYLINHIHYTDGEYTFEDINSDGYEELLIKSSYDEEDYKYSIDIYKYFTNSKNAGREQIFYLYEDSKLYSKKLKSINEYYINHMVDGNIFYYKYDSSEVSSTCVYSMENGKYYLNTYAKKEEITKNEYEDALKNYKEIPKKFDHDIDEIYAYGKSEEYQSDFLNSNTTNNQNTNNNLKCSAEDVDNIIKLLKQGKYVDIPSNTGITYTQSEGMQYYNSEYPYFTQYTIRCGSYSQTIKISHK